MRRRIGLSPPLRLKGDVAANAADIQTALDQDCVVILKRTDDALTMQLANPRKEAPHGKPDEHRQAARRRQHIPGRRS